MDNCHGCDHARQEIVALRAELAKRDRRIAALVQDMRSAAVMLVEEIYPPEEVAAVLRQQALRGDD